MASSIIKNNLPSNYKDRTDLVNQVVCYVKLYNYQTIIKDKPSSTAEWEKFLFQRSGWQLSVYGNSIFRSIFHSYKIENIDQAQLTGKIIINLNKLLKSPWCCKNTCLYVWNQPRWFELQMFNGDLKRYIDFYAPSL